MAVPKIFDGEVTGVLPKAFVGFESKLAAAAAKILLNVPVVGGVEVTVTAGCPKTD